MISIPGIDVDPVRGRLGVSTYLIQAVLRRLRKGLERVRRDGGVFPRLAPPRRSLCRVAATLKMLSARFLEELGALVARRETCGA